MDPKVSSKFIYENSTDVFIDDKNVESAVELVIISYKRNNALWLCNYTDIQGSQTTWRVDVHY